MLLKWRQVDLVTRGKGGGQRMNVQLDKPVAILNGVVEVGVGEGDDLVLIQKN